MLAIPFLVWLAVVLPVPPSESQITGTSKMVWDEVVQGEGENMLRWPVAVAAGSVDELVVADVYGSRLVVFRQGEGATGWVVADSIELPAAPVDLIHTGSFYLVSVRQPGGLFAVEGPDLRLRKLAPPPGTVPGALTAGSEDVLLVFDLANRRVLWLDGAARLKAEAPVDGHVTSLAPSPGGGFYAAFAQPPEIRRYGPNGELIASRPVPGVSPAPAWPSALEVATDGDLLVVDRHGSRLVVLGSGGRLEETGSRLGWDPGLLLFPSDLTRLPDGRIAVADQGNGRVQVFHRMDRGTSP
jgi:hypothetical protein